MAEIPSWIEDDAWDHVVIGGELIAGHAKVDIVLPSPLDVQKPAKGKKATISNAGDPPAEITITITLASPEDLSAFAANTKRLRPKTVGGAPDPQEILHPICALWGIAVVAIGDISCPSPSGSEPMVVTISAVEWVPQPIPAKSPAKKPAGGDAGANSSEDWNDVDGLISGVENQSNTDPLLCSTEAQP